MNIRHSECTFWQALRPFSLVVALVACGTGLALAVREAPVLWWQVLLVLVGGMLLQAGVNLINDYADLKERVLNADQQRVIRRNFSRGLVCFLGASVIGIWFSYHAGDAFLLLCAVGLLGALGYTVQPVNYKARGLGVVLVFWLMGVLMVLGSYVAVREVWSTEVVWLSVPVSLLVSALLLSNELRDYEADRAQQIATLVVRIGFERGQQLFTGLIVSAGLSVVLLALWQASFWLLLPLLAFFAAPAVLALSGQAASLRVRLPPLTGRLLLLFGVLYIAALLLSR